MSYYDTIDDDVQRAKEILARGKAEPLDDPDGDAVRFAQAVSGTIYRDDLYAAYKLLESFVAEIENYHLLLAVMGVTDYKAAVLKWKATLDRAEGR